MEIFNIGLGEMIVIAVLGLLLFGPERLPEMMRQFAKISRQLQSLSHEFNKALQLSLQDVEKPLKETRELLEQHRTEPTKGVQEATEVDQEAGNTLNGARGALAGELAEILGTNLMESPPSPEIMEVDSEATTISSTHDHEATV